MKKIILLLLAINFYITSHGQINWNNATITSSTQQTLPYTYNNV